METRRETYRRLSSMLAGFIKLRQPHIDRSDLSRLRIKVSNSGECPRWVPCDPEQDNFSLGYELEDTLCKYLGPRYDPASLVTSDG